MPGSIQAFLVLAAWVAALLLAGGCSRMPSLSDPMKFIAGSGTIHVDVPSPVPSSAPMRLHGRPASLFVAQFADARPGSPGRKVGNIRSTVRGMHATELAIDQDISSLLASATKNQLAAEGFRAEHSAEAADFRLEGVVKAFSLDIAGRDELAIVVEATLRQGRDGEVVWTGVIAEKSDRYAGVSGNSSASIAEYLGEGVATFAAKLGAAVRAGVTNASPRPSAAAPPEPPPAPLAGERRPAAAPGGGRLWVHTAPARAKVYVDDVYFGLTPLKVELPAGIVQLRLVLGGFRTVTEKVSVRSGDTTEVEVALEK